MLRTRIGRGHAEAKAWPGGRRSEPIGREHLDVFKSKISRKGKNALGLNISVGGFISDAMQEESVSTPFTTLEGGDVMG